MMKFKIEKRGYLGAVAGELKIDGFRIETPTRAISSNEIKNAENLDGLARHNKISNQIYEVKRQFKLKTKDGFNIHDVTKYIQKRIENASQAGDLRATTFTPVFPSTFPQTEILHNKLLQIQLNCDLDTSTVLDWKTSSPQAFEKRLAEAIRENDHHTPNRSVVPLLQIAHDENTFLKKINVIREFGLQNMTIIPASLKDYLENYYRLSDLVRDNQVFVHATELLKRQPRGTDVSMPHLYSSFGISSWSIKDIPNGFTNVALIVKKPALRLDGRTLRYITCDEHMRLHGEDLGCICMVCDERTTSEFFKVYDTADELKSAIKIHDVSQSFEELKNERNEILAKNHLNYIKSKPAVATALSKVLGIDMNSQQQL